IWIGSYKITANVARFGRNMFGMGETLPHQSSEQHGPMAHTKKPLEVRRTSYADVVRKHSDGRQMIEMKNQRPVPHQSAGNHNLVVFSKPEDNEWLKGCIVGEVHPVSLTPGLEQRLVNEGLSKDKVRPFGGKLILLSEKDESRLEDSVIRDQIVCPNGSRVFVLGLAQRLVVDTRFGDAAMVYRYRSGLRSSSQR
ncbi:hypothetical protein Ancab_011488, partial [Ancistrocladus abbreviatus]